MVTPRTDYFTCMISFPRLTATGECEGGPATGRIEFGLIGKEGTSHPGRLTLHGKSILEMRRIEFVGSNVFFNQITFRREMA